MYEPEFEEILEEASLRMRRWSRHYMCQDINIRHGLEYWVYQVTKERLSKASEEEKHNED